MTTGLNSSLDESKVISIVGRVDLNITKDNNVLLEAQKACFIFGEELAKSGWKLAVYTSDTRFIETDIIKGYLSTGVAKDKSIVCYYPQGIKMNFPQMNSSGKKYFNEQLDSSHDWEVSFYRSLTKVDAILLMGGGKTTMTAGQIALSRGISILSIAEFGGSANEIWKNLKSEKTFLDDDDLQNMAKWDDDSAKMCVTSLNKQYSKISFNIKQQADDYLAIKDKADRWDAYNLERKTEKSNFYLVLVLLVVFVGLLIAGLISTPPTWVYPIITVLGLCAAGGVGATIRMVTPNPPESKRLIAPLLGITVGLLFSLLYLLPQLIKSASLLVPTDKIDTSTRIQYVSSVVVAFLAGLGFDYSLEQLLKRSRQDVAAISVQKAHENKPGGVTPKKP